MKPVDRADVDRTCLYYEQLYDTFGKFSTAANQSIDTGGLGSFFCAALKNGNLLTNLARILDTFVLTPLNKEMAFHNSAKSSKKILTFQDFYDNYIFDNDRRYFDYNVRLFQRKYSDMNLALNKICIYYYDNIIQCCRRVKADQADIQTVFFAPDQPRALARIDPTGSDFHKGGKQVLILTFEASASKQLKLVYKPSDLEIDCLLVGKAASVNSVITPNFMDESLAEIFNQQIANTGTATAIPLPTYKILPRRYRTMQPAGPPPFTTLRDAYGYIEFLACWDAGSSALNHYNDTPSRWENWGLSSFVLTNRQKTTEIISTFYRLIGQWTALACTFSMRDLHVENMIVHAEKPYLIDLENSLDRPILDISDTEMFALNAQPLSPNKYDRSSVQGLYAEKEAYVIGMSSNNAFQIIKRLDEPKFIPMQNRLYIENPTRQIVVPQASPLIAGMVDGFTIIAGSQLAMAAWWTRVQHVQVRVIPVTTGDFYKAIDGFFWSGTNVDNFDSSLSAFASESVKLASDKGVIQTRAIVWVIPSTLQGLKNLDIPIFYRVNYQLDIVDSHGNIVRPVDRVTAPDGAVYTTGQQNYFRTNPTTLLKSLVDQLQSNATRRTYRIKTTTNQIRQRLNVAGAPSTAFFEPVDDANQGQSL